MDLLVNEGSQIEHIEYLREAGSEGIELVEVYVSAAPERAGQRGPSLLPRPRLQHGGGSHDPGEAWMVKIGSRAYGAFGLKHLDALANIDEVEVTAGLGPNRDKVEALAAERGIPAACASFEDFLASDVDAVILSTPTQMHCSQSCRPWRRRTPKLKFPWQTVSPMPKRYAAQERTGVVGMVGHVRRFNPSHQYIKNRIDAGEFNIQQMDAQTYFFRRSNLNAKGEPRSWTDHLLWHHACHTIDLFMYQTGEIPSEVFGLQGLAHPDLGIAMDMTIGMKTPSGKLCTLSLSFTNDSAGQLLPLHR